MRDKSGRTPLENALQHIVAGLVFVLASWLLFGNVLYGAIAATFFFIGRERRDYEIKEHIPVKHWYRGWNVLKWDIPDLAVIPVVWIVYVMFG